MTAATRPPDHPSVVGARRPVPVRAAGQRRQHHRQRRAAHDRPRARGDAPATCSGWSTATRSSSPRLLLLGGAPRRPVRPAPDAADRAWSLFAADLAGRRARRHHRAADRRPGGDGRRRGADLPGHAGPAGRRPSPTAGSGPPRSASGRRSPAWPSRIGPVSGGLLLEHFSWGSVFLVNRAAGRDRPRRRPRCCSPSPRDPAPGRFDPVGAVASVAGVGLLVWTTIEAPGARLGLRRHDRRLPRRRGRRWRPSSSWELRRPRPAARRPAVHQPAVLRRQRGDRAGLLRPVRLHLPDHPVLPGRPRLRHPARPGWPRCRSRWSSAPCRPLAILADAPRSAPSSSSPPGCCTDGRRVRRRRRQRRWTSAYWGRIVVAMVLMAGRARAGDRPGHRGDHGRAAAGARPAPARRSTTPCARSAARWASPSSAR